MSTWIYLVCGSHEPPLVASGESGQHEFDLPQVRTDIQDRALMAKAWEEDARWPEWFRNNTAAFLYEHQACKIGIKNEYGDWYDPDVEAADTRLIEPVWSEP